MVVGTYFTHKSLTSFMKIQKSSKIFKPSIHKFVSAGTNVAKIWLTLYFMDFVKLSQGLVRCTTTIFLPKMDFIQRSDLVTR